MVVNRLACFVDVFVEGQILVQPDSKAFDIVLWHDPNLATQNCDFRATDLVHLLSCTHEQYLGLGWVQTEAIVSETVVDCEVTSIQNAQ